MARRRLPRNIRQHGDGFRAVVGRDGTRYRSPTFDTIERAVAWRDAFTRIRAQSPILAPLTLARGLELIHADLEATAARADTFAFYRNHARILFAGLGGADVLVQSIDPDAIRRYVSARRAAGVAPGTIVGKELFVLRRILRLATAAGYVLVGDPFQGVRLPRGRAGRFDVLTRERVAELVAAMRVHRARKAGWHADLVELLFATGLRRSELARLRVVDIDLDAGRIFVDGKTGNRYQPFGAALVPVLRRLVAAAQPDGRLVRSYRTVERLFETWQRRLGEPRFTPHVMRHSYATAMAALVDPFELMALMDHKSLKQTSRYYHARGVAVRAALDRLRLDPPPAPRTSTGPAADRSTATPSTPRAPQRRRGTGRG